MPRGCKTTCISQPRGSRMRLGPSESSLHVRAATRPDPALQPQPGVLPDLLSPGHRSICPCVQPSWPGMASFLLFSSPWKIWNFRRCCSWLDRKEVCVAGSQNRTVALVTLLPLIRRPPGAATGNRLCSPWLPPHLPGERRRKLLVSGRYYRD